MKDQKAKAIILTPTEGSYQPMATQIVDILNDLKVEPILAQEKSKQEELPVSIVSEIDKADLVIADVSGASPNVMFEVGYAQGRGKPIVYIIRPDEANKIPSNLSGQMFYSFDPTNPDRFKTTISGRVQRAIGEVGDKNE